MNFADKPLRFRVMDKVQCNMADSSSPADWHNGIIAQLHYREADWNQEVPYQVKLNQDSGGRLIFVPLDDDRVIRLIPRDAHDSSCKCCNGGVQDGHLGMMWRKKNGKDTFTGIVQIRDGVKTCWSEMGAPSMYKLEDAKDVLGAKTLLSFAEFMAEMKKYDWAAQREIYMYTN